MRPGWWRQARREQEPVEQVEARVLEVTGRLERRTAELMDLVQMGRGIALPAPTSRHRSDA